VWYDELIWLPLVGLDRLLITIGQTNRAEGQAAIAFVAQSFRQQWAAVNALVTLTADEVRQARTIEAIANVAAQLAWLPDTLPKDLETILPPIQQIAAHARAALESDTNYNQAMHWQDARTLTQKVREGLAFSRNGRLRAEFGAALGAWDEIFAQALTVLQKDDAIPNPYVAGNPLITNSKVFRGRRDLFVALERELTSAADQPPTLMLYGARRSGKSSALKQLPARLGPDYIPVELDLQKGVTGDNATDLLAYLAGQVVDSAQYHRRLRLPALSRDVLTASPYMRFLEWVSEVEKQLGERQLVLLNLDEFEKLEEMLNERRLDKRMFDLLRALIQHHPRFVVLLSGSHTLAELSPLWSDTLINVRTLRLGPLEEKDARELIESPIENFPLTYEAGAVDDLIAATACQPFLIQATCRDLVNRMNNKGRSATTSQPVATRADVAYALDSCLTSGEAYFIDLWRGRDTDETQREVMRTIATGKDLTGFQNLSGLDGALRRLVRREILEATDGSYRFKVELVRRWVEKQEPL
jgi:hypothetical protein